MYTAYDTMDDYISIHAPRVGSDCQDFSGEFSPRLFQSTLPVWGATCRLCRWLAQIPISIHAPRVGSDQIYDMAIHLLDISIHAPRVGSDQIQSEPF